MKLHVPQVLKIDEKTERNDPIQQIGTGSRWIEGALASFTRDKLKGWLFQPQAGTPDILLVPAKSKNVPDTFAYVISSDGITNSEKVDVSTGTWLRFPAPIAAANEAPDGRIESVLRSWLNAFSYIQEDATRDVLGLRPPQIGALHAVHAHWSVTDSTATIVMPTGTGKTETMLSILTSARCSRLLVVVPTDALRSQIAEKFLTLGLLKKAGVGILTPETACPIVCRLEHVLPDASAVDSLMKRAQVLVATSTLLALCSAEVQERLAHHCPYLFIDEAHHAEAPTWSAFKSRFKKQRIVQFTATPFREDGRLLDGQIIYKYPLKRAQEEGYFRPIRFEPVVEFDPKKADAKIAEKAVARLREELDKGHILMARVGNVKRAKQVYELYKQHEDLKPIQLHTGMSAKSREAAKRQLLSKGSRIVVCVDMLGEGFDMPELKVAAFHDIRKSLAVTLQLAGRFTRAREDLGDATFVANVADVDVQEELKKLYSRDPDWNLLLPALSERMIGEQTSLQDFVNNFDDFPSEIPLKTVMPAASAVVYRTRCADWNPDAFLAGIPAAETCERVHHTINAQQHTLVVVTGRRSGIPWTDSENIYGWQWDLYVVYWAREKSLLFINGSSNNGEFSSLAEIITANQATLIRDQIVFRTFARINRLRLQNVGLSEQIGRSIRYTGRMGSDVEPGITQLQRGNAQKSVLAGVGFENGALTSIGASRKGRIWSHRREHLDQFVSWCEEIGTKLLDDTIDPDQVLEGTLVPVTVTQRPEKMALHIDWPEDIYIEAERNWIFTLEGQDYALHQVGITLINPSVGTPLRFEISSEDTRVEFELVFVGNGDDADFRFLLRGDAMATIQHGPRAQAHSLVEFFHRNPPSIWFADGSSLLGNRYVELRAPQPLFQAERLEDWNWNGVNIKKESQGDQKQADTIQARVIRELALSVNYQIIFDDDNSGEAADVVAITVVGGLENPTRVEIELYHCKYSAEVNPGARVGDLYEVCGQAQKSIWWAGSLMKKADLVTHLMRRESDRLAKERPSRLERGTMDTLLTIKEIANLLPVSLSIAIVQPGVSKATVSDDQLQLLGVTENFLWEMYQLPFRVITSG